MSSVEIAKLTVKRHDNVMRDIRSMLLELHGKGGVLSFEDTHLNPQNGQSYPIFRLPKRECLILVSGYSVTLRARIIDRWQQLEAHVAAQAANPHAIPAFNEAEILRRIGGVVKAVTGRQIADLREGMEAALETIGRLAQELRAAKSAAAPTFDLAGTVTSRDVLDMAGIRPETRVRGTGLIITRHLKTYCLERGLAAFRTPTEIDVYRRWRFPREAAADWVTREQGGEIIRNHIATSLKRKGAKGQGLLHLVPTEKH
ncbi:Rha family transcriptional regulator [Aquabacter sp. L1I39]|nr:Rha family transcriptional regulator [Aquabacter sp. L1I39]